MAERNRHAACCSRPRCDPSLRHAATVATSKGRLIRCTVPGSTPNRAAILRTPSVRPGLAITAAGYREYPESGNLVPLFLSIGPLRTTMAARRPTVAVTGGEARIARAVPNPQDR